MLQDGPSISQVTAQYEAEKRMAQRLLNAPRETRSELYGEIYEELQRHFQAEDSEISGASEQQVVALQLTLLRPFLNVDCVFLEVGCGDAALAIQVAGSTAQVHAVEPCATAVEARDLPENFKLIHSGAPQVELADKSVDLAYSCHVIEHLHPQDAREHVQDMHRVLNNGGHYVCVTPNRLLGPHDISKHFDRVATGLHLREYSYTELARLLREAGFTRVTALHGVGIAPTERSLWSYCLAESLLEWLPPTTRRALLRRVGKPAPFRALEQVVVLAAKNGWQTNPAVPHRQGNR